MKSNVEIIQELYRSFKEKDYDSFKAICDKDISWKQNPGFPKGSSYIGSEEVIRNVFKAFDDSWENWKFIIDNYHDAGETIVVTGIYKGKNRKTGKSFIAEAAHVYGLKSGKVVSFQQYADSKVIWDAMG